MKSNIIYSFIFLLSGLSYSHSVCAQGAENISNNPTDVRSAALGGTQTALSGNVFSVFHNASQLVYSTKRIMTGYTYLPWMREVMKDIDQHTVALSFKPTDVQVVFGGFRFLTQPSLDHTDENGNHISTIKPRDYAIDLGYSREIIKNLAASVSFTYMQFNANTNYKKAILAMNAGVLYNKHYYGESPLSLLSFGLQACDFGVADFSGGDRKSIPWKLKAGGRLVMTFRQKHSLEFSSDVDYTIQPSDFQAVNGSLGVEYNYHKIASLRGGYHLGDREHGYWRYGSCGLGLDFKYAAVDFAYLLTQKACPMYKTWMLSVQLAI